MSDTSPVLSLPFIQPSQAQKHVTHNEALRFLDVAVQAVVLNRDQSAPPPAPASGDRHIVAAGGSGDWAGHDGEIALFDGAVWQFIAAQSGWQVQVLAEDRSVVFDGTGWAGQLPDLNNLDGVGIGTGSDATNRLAVAADATLLTHAGDGHQLKINKSQNTDTASLLFQTGWSGRAEMGTAGSDDFTIKVSADGVAWTTALDIDPGTGLVSLPAGAAVTSGSGFGIGTSAPDEMLHVAGGAVLEDSGPMLKLKDTGGTAGFRTVSLVNDGDGLSVQSRTDTGTWISTDYFIQRDGSGATLHQWSVGGSPVGRWNGTGLAVGTTNVLKPFYAYTGAQSDLARFTANHASYSSKIVEISCARSGSSDFNFLRATSNGFSDVEFQFSGDGNGTCDGSWTGGGADYAEYFEWADGNPDAEDRRGVSVVLDGEKIRAATPGEEPIGVISGDPSVVGDGDIGRWKGKYLRDDFGGYLWQTYEVLEWTGADGKPVSYAADAVPDGVLVPDNASTSAHKRRILNPDYTSDSVYVSRADRAEWDTVGLMGKLRLRKGQATAARWIKMRQVSDGVEEWLVR